MEEPKFEPGAAKFGNFINYYYFNPPENRINQLPTNLNLCSSLRSLPILCLDVGCNSGELTKALHKYLQRSLSKDGRKCSESDIHIIGVDIDSTLIERANEYNKNENITYLCLDIMSNEAINTLMLHLKLHKKEQFDITFSFGITMWIHLNHGDDGLESFLVKMCKYTKVLFLEPQPWKSYQNAIRRNKKCHQEPFENYCKLKIRSNVETDIINFLQGSCDCVKMFETGRTNWGRTICIYSVNNSLDK